MAGIEVRAGLPAGRVVSRTHALTVKQFLSLCLLQVSQQREPSLSGVGVTDIDLQLTEEEREAVKTLALIIQHPAPPCHFPAPGAPSQVAAHTHLGKPPHPQQKTPH